MFSAHLPIADIRQGTSKLCRSTRTIPAWLTVSATRLVLPSVNGSSSPSVRRVNFSTITPGNIRSVSPICVTS